MDPLEFKKISLEDKALFDHFFKKFPPDISEYTFTNLFVWRHSRGIEFTKYKEGLIILATEHNEKYFLPPVGYKNPEEIISFLAQYAAQYQIQPIIKRAGENLTENLNNSRFKIHEDRDNFDYIYNTDDLAILKGRKFSNKRNFVHKFCSEYYHRYASYTPECREACLKVAENWLKGRKKTNNLAYKSEEDELTAIKELLIHYEKLEAKGGVICVDKNIIAFAFGEPLNKNTFVIHFEKAETGFIGLYQTINKLFVENEICACSYEFVNREQDLGINGIRKAKLDYNPVRFGKKYMITLDG